MQQLRILNTKERKELVRELEVGYDADLSILMEYQILKGDGKYFIVTRECLEQDLEGLRIDSIGLRLATEEKGKPKPTVHAVQLFYQKARKTIALDEQQTKEFIKNQEIPTEKPDGQYIITYNNHPIDASQVKNKKLKRS